MIFDGASDQAALGKATAVKKERKNRQTITAGGTRKPGIAFFALFMGPSFLSGTPAPDHVSHSASILAAQKKDTAGLPCLLRFFGNPADLEFQGVFLWALHPGFFNCLVRNTFIGTNLSSVSGRDATKKYPVCQQIFAFITIYPATRWGWHAWVLL